MSDFIKRMHLKEKAEEDLYFAKIERKLIQAQHEKEAEKVSLEKDQINDIRSKDKH